VRDGAGMISSLVFTSLSSSKFRFDIKRWKIFADLMVDLGITLEVAATIVPKVHFLPMICLGNVCKAMCGVAAGACGGAINLHWATGSDISEINAKFGAQNTISGGIGLVVGALFARSIDLVSQTTLWKLYVSLTVFHIYANIKSMRLVAFESLNDTRMDMIVSEFMTIWRKANVGQTNENVTVDILDKPVDSDKDANVSVQSKLSSLSPFILNSPQIISRKEPLLFFRKREYQRDRPLSTIKKIHFGVSFNRFVKVWSSLGLELNKERLTALLDKARSNGYIISSGLENKGKAPVVVVSIMENTTKLNLARAYFHALFLTHVIKVKDAASGNIEQLQMLERAGTEVGNVIDAAWTIFEKSAKLAGWDLSKTELQTEGFVISIKN